jgi:NAD(P)-dependent dehydrogenase (short-subunit alcohol dehydrogenase family)
MQHEAPADALADLAQTASARRRGAEVEIAGILDRQHMTTRAGHRSLLAPALDQSVHRYPRVRQKATEADNLATTAARQPPQAHALAPDHTLEKQSPPFSRRRSPNRPSSTDPIAAPPRPCQSRQANHGKRPRRIASTSQLQKICASPSARTGGLPGDVIYAATKGAVDSFTLGLAKEVGPEGIRVTCVRPGVIETDIFSGNAFGLDRVKELAQKNSPLQRIGQPHEVADMVLFLLSDQASFCTGMTYDVNGGR